MINGIKQTGTITIDHFGQPPHETTPEAMAALAGGVFPLADRAEGGEGDAFDFGDWYSAWRKKHKIEQTVPLPTHLKVEAADTFEALVPWEQLSKAAVQFAVEGGPLRKGGPIRLYVPNGSSACLNVKSIVACRFVHEESERGSVSYGFKNTFSPQDLRSKG